MTPKEQTIALTRYSATEEPGTSLAILYSAIEEAVCKYYEVIRLPPSSPRGRNKQLVSHHCDLVIASCKDFLPPPALNHRPAILYLPLGDFPKGAQGFRKVHANFCSCDSIAFSSTADLEIWRNISLACSAKPAMLPFFADEAAFRPATSSMKMALRRKYGIQNHEFVFLYFGRIAVEKNIQSLIRMIAGVIGAHGNVRLIIAGPVDNRRFEEFRAMREPVGKMIKTCLGRYPAVAKRTLYLDRQFARSDLPGLFNLADVFVNLTSNHDENFGFSQIEAMSCGLPVVCSRWGGLKDTVWHGETGLLVDASLSPGGVRLNLWQGVQFCKKLIRDRSFCIGMGQHARQHVIKYYSKRIFADRLRSLVEDCLVRRSRLHRSGWLTRARVATNRLSPMALRLMLEMDPRERRGLPRFTSQTYDLYAQLVRPYASSNVNLTQLKDEDILFLASDMLALEGSVLEDFQPAWSARCRLNKEQLRIVSWLMSALKKRGEVFFDHKSLRAVLQGAEGQLDQDILRLIERGIISRSTSNAAQDS